MTVPKEEPKAFVGSIELVREFNTKPERVQANVHYRLIGGNGGKPEFLSIVVDGDDVPVEDASEASLLQAYAKHRALEL